MTMAETARMEFAYQIQRFTHVNHMTAEMFAMECGVQKKTVDSALEEKPVSSRAMQKICSYVGITLDSLWQPPISENFLKLEEIMLDTVQPGVLPSIQLAAKNVVDALEGMPPYEQKRNLRWLRQIVEHSEMYIPKKPPYGGWRNAALICKSIYGNITFKAKVLYSPGNRVFCVHKPPPLQHLIVKEFGINRVGYIPNTNSVL